MIPNRLVRWKFGSLQDSNFGLKWSGFVLGKFPSLVLNECCSKFMFCTIKCSPSYESLKLEFWRVIYATFILCILAGSFHMPWFVSFWIFQWIIISLVLLRWTVGKMLIRSHIGST